MPQIETYPNGRVLMSIGWKDAMALRGGRTLEVETPHGLIGLRHGERSDDGLRGIASAYVWPDADELPYDRRLTVTESVLKRLESGDLRQDWWSKNDTFPHRVYIRYV